MAESPRPRRPVLGLAEPLLWQWGPSLLYALLVLLIRPWVDAPCNDDWAYAWSARHLAETGELRISDWSAPLLIPQTLAGAVAVRLFGFSFVVLKAVVVVVAALSGWVIVRLVGLFCPSRSVVVLGALTYLLNPLFLWLSTTYMTEVIYLSAAAAAGLAYAQYLRKPTALSLWLGAAMATTAILSRQIGIVIPLGFLLTLMALPGWRRQLHQDWNLAAAALLPIAAGGMMHYWYATYHGVTSGYAQSMAGATDWGAVLYRSPTGIYALVLYGGLLVAPMAALALRTVSQRLRASPRALGAFAIGAGFLLLLAWQPVPRILPYVGNVMHPWGLGPSANVVLPGSRSEVLPPVAWEGATLAFLLSGLIAITAILGSWRARDGSDGSLLLLLILLGAHALVLIITPLLFDRYFLLLLPWALPLLAAQATTGRATTALGWLLLAVVAGFAALGTADYVAWSRARAVLVETAESQGADAEEVDAGFEFVCMHSFDHRRWELGDPDAMYWWHPRAYRPRYRVAFSPLAGQTVCGSAGFWSPLTFHRETLYLMRVPADLTADVCSADERPGWHLAQGQQLASQGHLKAAVSEYEQEMGPLRGMAQLGIAAIYDRWPLYAGATP